LYLVTGARGAVGSGVLAGLRAAGVPVRAAGRDPTGSTFPTTWRGCGSTSPTRRRSVRRSTASLPARGERADRRTRHRRCRRGRAVGPPGRRVPHLTGPASLTFAEQVGVIAAHLGRPIEARELDPATAREQMLARMPEGVVDSLFRYWEHTLDGPAPVTGEVAARTGHPARTYASWVADTL
jgi:uncharacterized protein YbjT (DUF2867 family)